MTEEKKEEIAFEIFGKRVEELKKMTENIGKSENQNIKKDNEEEVLKEKIKDKKEEKENNSKREKIKIEKIIIKPKPPIKIKNEKKLQIPEFPKNPEKKVSILDNFKKKFTSFKISKIKQPEIKKREKVIKKEPKKSIKINKTKPSTIKSFFGIRRINSPQKNKKLIEEKIVNTGILPREKQEIFANFKQLNEKIDKNKEEIYNRLIRESAESKRMIESEREEIKKQMIELLADSIDKLDSKDREIKGELYEELQKIKNKFYGEKKEIRNLISNNSEESRKLMENEKEKIKEEFLTKIANLRNKIAAEEKKTKELNEREKENEQNEGYTRGEKTFSSFFSSFRGKQKKSEPKIEQIKEESTEENLEEGDIITGMPEIPKFVDLGMPKFSPAKTFMDTSKDEFPEARPFLRIEEEAIDNEDYGGKQEGFFDTSKKFTRNIEMPGDYEKSIKNILAPQIVSKYDLEFEKRIQKAMKKGMDAAEKKNKSEKKQIKPSRAVLKKSVYVGEQDFNNARNEIEQTNRNVSKFEKNFSEKAQIEKREHEKISKILEDAEEISHNFSKINSGVLGKIRQ